MTITEISKESMDKMVVKMETPLENFRILYNKQKNSDEKM